ncbi:MAG: PhoH family protein [Clostridiales bacterium]|nr:PhoH family protein [Clostridiales bacterium]
MREAYSEGELRAVFGAYDANLKTIESLCDVRLRVAGDEVVITGQSVELARLLLDKLIDAQVRGETVDPAAVKRYYDILCVEPDGLENIVAKPIATNAYGKKIFAKTRNQKRFADAVNNNLLTFAIGPAGTGKTYLAVAMAAAAVKRGEVKRIILTRPAIEAGEKLGFLPGDLQMKVDPYLRPLYDALGDMFGDDYGKLIERGTVEIAPLAYMRGRTLSSAFMILDEAQNTTPEQMKMFLTRFGEGSRAIVTGDDTQVDLQGAPSGLKDAERVLSGVESVAFVRLTGKDVVRHDLVQRIVEAYDKDASKGQAKPADKATKTNKNKDSKTE